MTNRPEGLAAAEPVELDQKGAAGDLRAQPPQERDRRRGGAPRRQQIVHDEHPLTDSDRVGVDLEHRLAVFELVRLGDSCAGQSALFADRNKSRSQRVGDCSSQDEPARFDARDGGHADLAPRLRHCVDGVAERARVGEQHRDVPEQDSWSREVWDVSDKSAQTVQQLPARHPPGSLRERVGSTGYEDTVHSAAHDRWRRRRRVNAALSALSAGARQLKDWWTVSAFVPLAVLVLALLADHQIYTVYRFDGPVHADGEGYYAYLPAYLIYFDPTFKTFIAGSLLPAYAAMGHPRPEVFGFSLQANGNWLDKYGIGSALLMLPFFLVGHAIALATKSAANGYSSAESVAVALSSIAYVVAGLYALRALLRRWFPDWSVAVTLVAVAFGGGLFVSATWDPAYSHAYSFFAVALALLFTVRWYEKPESWWRIVAVGLSCGLVIDIRLTNGLLLIALPVIGVATLTQARQRAALLWSRRWHVVAGAGAFILALLPQSLVWHLATGDWIVRSYPGESFAFLHPHLIESLLSFKPHGLLPYAPVLILSLVGLALAWLRRRDLAFPVTLAFLPFWYLVSSWWDWSFSSGFGDRAFVDVLPLLAIPLALCVSFSSRRTLRYTSAGSALLLTGVTCVLMVGYWQGRVPGDGVTVDGYFLILGHPHGLALPPVSPPRPVPR